MSFLTDVVTGIFDNEARDKAADAQVDASKRAIEEQRRQFNIATQLTAPQRYYGDQANALLGMNFGMTPYSETPGQRAVQQFSGYGVTDPNAAAYLAQRGPEFAQQMQRDLDAITAAGRRQGVTMDTLVNDHFRLHGQREGLLSPQQAGQQYTATQGGAGGGGGAVGGGGTPGVVARGDGSYGVGGDGMQTLTNGPGGAPGAPTPASYQQQAYDRFLGSGEARSMLETTANDMDMYTGQFGAGGKAVSGSHLKALNDVNRRNTNAAFGQYSNALRSMAGAGQVATQGQANNAMVLGQRVAGQLTDQGNVRASAYGNQYHWGNALGDLEKNAAQAMGFMGGGGA